MFKPDRSWDYSSFPLAYLITICTYGSRLHGDGKNTVDIHNNKNIYGFPKVEVNESLRNMMSSNMRLATFILNKDQRVLVEEAIKEACYFKDLELHAVNARTNHVHIVLSAQMKPEPIADLFKRYATRKLRDHDLVYQDSKIWSRGRSRRYLWKENDLTEAIDYVLYGQGKLPFEMD